MDLTQWMEFFKNQGAFAAVAAAMFYFYRKDLVGRTDFVKDMIGVVVAALRDNTAALESLKEHLQHVGVCPIMGRIKDSGNPRFIVKSENEED